MILFRKHRQLALLPAFVWLMAQLTITCSPLEHVHWPHAQLSPAHGEVDETTKTEHNKAGHSHAHDHDHVAQNAPDNAEPEERPHHNHMSGCKWCQNFASSEDLILPGNSWSISNTADAKQRWSDAIHLVGLKIAVTGFSSRAPPVS